jgi:sulfur-oxidizing protein SoxX
MLAVKKKTIRAASAVAMLLGGLVLPLAAGAAEGASAADQGKKIAFDRAAGNCLACHAMAGGESPGNIGPPLVAMKSRFKDKAALRAQIWDPMVRNPLTTMPPFGRNRILTEQDIDKVAEFIWTL